MVSIDTIEKKLDELFIFFNSASVSSALSSVDRESAAYGLEKVELIKEILRRYRHKPENVFLKRIHGAFFSVTRGVEGFNDEETNRLFNEKCKGIYEIIKHLEQNIKW